MTQTLTAVCAAPIPGPHPLDRCLDTITRTIKAHPGCHGANVDHTEVLSEVYLVLRHRYQTYKPHLLSLAAWIRQNTNRLIPSILARLSGAREVWEGRKRTWVRSEEPASHLLYPDSGDDASNDE
jgi:hypothetical protein